MAPTRRSSEGLLARVNFPLYSLQMLTNRHVIVAGGGGSAKTGVANGFEIFELSHDGTRFIAEEFGRHETGPKVVMNCACYYGGKNTYLAAGQESHCQLYNVQITVVKEHSEGNKHVNGKVGMRKRRSSKNPEGEENVAKVDGNSNESVRRLKFELKALDSIQTDFKTGDQMQRVVRISRCGKLMATGGIDGHVRLWNFPSLKPHLNITEHSKEIDDLDFSPDSKTIVSLSKDGQAVIWCTASGKKVHSLSWVPSNGSKFLFKRCRFGPVEGEKNRSRVFTITNAVGKPSSKVYGYIQQWDSSTGALEKSVEVNESLSALAVRDDGRFIAVGTMFTGSVAIYIAFSLQRALNVRQAHSTFVTGLEFLPSKDCGLTTTAEAAVLSISIDNKICIHSLPYRRTLPPWLAILLIIITLFCAFVFCSYIGL